MYMDRVFAEKEAAIDYAKEIAKLKISEIDDHIIASDSENLFVLNDINTPKGFIWTKLK